MKTSSLIIAKINILLVPLEKILVHNLSLIKKIVLVVSCLVIFLIFVPGLQKDTGEQAKNILLFILFLPIIAQVIGLSLAKKMMPLRKELGILMGIFAWVHSVGYFFQYPDALTASYFWWQEGFVSYLAVGLVALIITTLLMVTSNTYSMKILGKRWKLLHKTTYLLAVLVLVHIILIRWSKTGDIEYKTLILLGCYIFGKILEHTGITLAPKGDT